MTPHIKRISSKMSCRTPPSTTITRSTPDWPNCEFWIIRRDIQTQKTPLRVLPECWIQILANGFWRTPMIRWIETLITIRVIRRKFTEVRKGTLPVYADRLRQSVWELVVWCEVSTKCNITCQVYIFLLVLFAVLSLLCTKNPKCQKSV